MEEPAALPRAEPWSEGTVRWLDLHDLRYLLYLPAAALISWFTPERLWDGLCRRAAGIGARAGIGKGTNRVAHVSRLVDGCIGMAAAAGEFIPVLTANSHRARLHIFRCYKPSPWAPPLTLIGREHVAEGLLAGRGVILWIAPFVFSDLLTKMALHRAGFAVAHLSRRGHGFSETRLGARLLNPLWTRIENRYLTDRLMMSAGHSAKALRTLVARIRGNQIVSVTVGNQGQHAFAVPFLKGSLPIADAVAALALRTGATLLPIFTVRQADGSFVTTIEPPLAASADPAAGDAVGQLLRQEAARLEWWVRRYPDQFMAWDTIVC